MCGTCGCAGKKTKLSPPGVGNTLVLDVMQNLQRNNDAIARTNRKRFDARGVLVINVMSSPGSGKTTLLERTINTLKSKYRIGVIEGDLETENDAKRIRETGAPAIQITTGSACHLDAVMIQEVMDDPMMKDLDQLFIENVGNLVCPASFDLGHHCNVVLLSVTEGDDKPSKYPVMFRAADLVLISKSDLLSFLDDFSVERARQNLRHLASAVPVLSISSRQAQTREAWLDWLESQMKLLATLRQNKLTLIPSIQREGQLLHAQQKPQDSKTVAG